MCVCSSSCCATVYVCCIYSVVNGSFYRCIYIVEGEGTEIDTLYGS